MHEDFEIPVKSDIEYLNLFLKHRTIKNLQNITELIVSF